ncbi:HD domain-containing protein [Thermophagus xiamenensis]|uniref:HDIG domain-containing protein n=1 Tax=Thermophagus xiamenensis TaxID=385682 RepID=A0A1I1WH17_9BACT|nr:HD domain-containing protein [Thermophagus xiamenensis]SFD94291.1 HDIG domain-containing protein [Thermophagus xiamenensis]
MKPTREEALKLFKEYNQSQSLFKHALAVEAVMKTFALKYDEDPEKWGVIGLVHDLDYEKFPDQHCIMTRKILEENGWPEDYIRAIESHGWGICTDTKPEHIMEKVLYATDELTGLIVTSTLVRPDKNLHELKVKSVLKKWKDKRFAAGVDRDVIQKGANMIGIELPDLIAECIEAMKSVASELELDGNR